MHKASASVPDSTGFLRFGGVVLLVSGLLVPSTATQAQVTTHPQVRSVVFQDQTGNSRASEGNASASASVLPQAQVGFAGSLVFQDPKGTYEAEDRKSTRLNSSHVEISYAVFCLK